MLSCFKCLGGAGWLGGCRNVGRKKMSIGLPRRKSVALEEMEILLVGLVLLANDPVDVSSVRDDSISEMRSCSSSIVSIAILRCRKMATRMQHEKGVRIHPHETAH
jgi:hypothetical protein